MQSSKQSKKITQSAKSTDTRRQPKNEQPPVPAVASDTQSVLAAPAANMAAADNAISELTAKPRTTKSSSTSKSNLDASAVDKAGRRSAAKTTAPAAATHSDTVKAQKTTSEALEPAGQEPVPHEDIARLAYSLWAARDFQPGSPEEDWLRAEHQLKSFAAAR